MIATPGKEKRCGNGTESRMRATIRSYKKRRDAARPVMFFDEPLSADFVTASDDYAPIA